MPASSSARSRGETIPGDRLAPELKTPESVSGLAWAHERLSGADQAVAVVLTKSAFTSADGRFVNFAFQLLAPAHPVAVRLSFRAGNAPVLKGFRVHEVLANQEANPTSADAGPRRSLFIGAMLDALALAIASLARLWRAPPGRKWPWALFILVGVGSLTMKWSTGKCRYEAFRVVVLSVAGVRSPAAGSPWLLSVAFPLGALLYLFKPARAKASKAE